MRKFHMTPEEVAKVIEVPLERWPGNCFGIASKMVEKKLVEGEAVYGHWTGPIAAGNIFSSRADVGFCNHGWVLQKDGTVIDPTRWVFESRKPYIFIGHPEDEPACSDFDEETEEGVCWCGHIVEEHREGFFRPCEFCQWPYDEGGNALRALLQCPAPKFAKGPGKPIALESFLTSKGRIWVKNLFKDTGKRPAGKLSWVQCQWLASLPYEALDSMHGEVYGALEKCNLTALIPIDNLRKHRRENR